MRDTKISWAHVLTSRRPVWNDPRTGLGHTPADRLIAPFLPDLSAAPYNFRGVSFLPQSNTTQGVAVSH